MHWLKTKHYLDSVICPLILWEAAYRMLLHCERADTADKGGYVVYLNTIPVSIWVFCNPPLNS